MKTIIILTIGLLVAVLSYQIGYARGAQRQKLNLSTMEYNIVSSDIKILKTANVDLSTFEEYLKVKLYQWLAMSGRVMDESDDLGPINIELLKGLNVSKDVTVLRSYEFLRSRSLGSTSQP